ncbi:MAG: cellulase family glycosylhydrolase [Spirochaetes bacterium]|jgi:aryl-phospho-beta-D-glucosidase BglC (GH1 family)|nr:cellulase family glycosylhydrolase [Spirochaetota bacterium]
MKINSLTKNALLISFLCFALIIGIINIQSQAMAGKGFVHASSRNIIDHEGKKILLKGIAFGNQVWSNPGTAPSNHHTAGDYKVIRDLGFNSVRFYLNYKLFEDDNNPYKYKKDGFDWIDKNITWAKKNGIYLILNMHVPQGGFQSNAETTDLWTKEGNEERFLALWKKIAKHCRDESTIAGYSILNEPAVYGGIDKWSKFTKKTVSAIRETDKNHMIIIERMQCNVTSPGNADWNENVNGMMNFTPVKDTNIMYEFHFYKPFPLTHQGAPWIPALKGVKAPYPGPFKDWDGTTKTGDKKYLQKEFKPYIDFSKKRNVPVYLGEFGVIKQGFSDGKSALAWIDDILDICVKNQINFNYHTYHEVHFGLFQNEPHKLPGNLNKPLAEYFKNRLNSM